MTAITINIDLDKSSDARYFEFYKDDGTKDDGKNELVHKKEIRSVIDKIEKRLEELKKPNNSNADNEHDRKHDVISVLGARGTGKTSFLLSVKEYCKNRNEIQVLKIIDPTLIEEKGHVFLNIVSLISDAVNEKLDSNNADPLSPEYFKREAWNTKVQSLASGLPSLDGIGSELTNTQWQDPEYIMRNGLRSVSAARKLEQSFNELIDFGLEILGKKMFLLILDDIDVSFTKGWPVLETLRKYLTSRQVITILSGDMKLFSLSVRKQQWSNFGKALLKNEADRLKKSKEYNATVTELEGQYLRKVLKPELRVHLTTLGEKLRSNDRQSESKSYIINVLGFKSKEPINIDDVYDQILATFGVKNSYQAEAYKSFVLSLPLRTQIRFLSIFKNGGSEELQHEISDVFLSELYDKKVQLQLMEGREQFLSPVILDLLIREKQLNETYQLQPVTSDDVFNACLVTLNFIFSDSIKHNPFLIFDYFIKIGYVRNLLDPLGYVGDIRKDISSSTIFTSSIEGICRHAGILQDKVLRDSAALLLSYMISVRADVQLEGVVKLESRAVTNKGATRLFMNRIDSIYDKATITQKPFIYFPASIYKTAQKNRSQVIYSIYTLLGAIAELIRRHKTDMTLDNGILELSQIRIYNGPDFDRSIIEGADEFDTGYSQQKRESRDGITNLSNRISTWVRAYEAIAISTHLLGKISTRIFYAFNNINSNSNRADNAGVAMHRMVVAFMNAVLIEDAKENLQNARDINLDNTVTSNQIFINNLKALKGRGKELLLSRWILSCPILIAYLDSKLTEDESFGSFISAPSLKADKEVSVYSLLNNVPLLGTGDKRAAKPAPKPAPKRKMYNQDFYEYLKGIKGSYDLVMNSKDSKKIFNRFPEFFNVGRNDIKLGNFRRFVKKKRVSKW